MFLKKKTRACVTAFGALFAVNEKVVSRIRLQKWHHKKFIISCV